MILFFAGIFIGILFGFLACAVLTASNTADSQRYHGYEEPEQKEIVDE